MRNGRDTSDRSHAHPRWCYPARVRIVMLVANPVVFDGRVLRHAQTLAAAGHQVAVLGVIGPRDPAQPLPSGLGFAVTRLDRRRHGVLPRLFWAASALRRRAALRLCGTLATSTVAQVPALAGLAVAAWAPELCLQALRQGFDVVHSNDLSTLPAAAWAARALGRPYVYDAHELYIDEDPDLSRDERAARLAAEGHYIRDAAAVLTVNRLIADDLQQRYHLPPPQVIRNLPAGVSAPAPDARPEGDRGTLHLLYHGANLGLDQHGTDDILRALVRLRQGPTPIAVRLTMRGGLTDTAERALRARLTELGLLDTIRLAEKVPGAAALVEAAVADGADLGLAVHPGLCQSYHFTTSSKVYEYQAAGLAVCATDLVGNRLAVGAGAGVFYTAGDDAELAERLRELALDRPRLRAMQRAAYAHATTELRWETESRQLLAVYERLAVGR
jgi:glycosyltransferase involved in cell wall biosynthesis